MNNRQSRGQDASSVAAFTDTATWQLPTLPNEPEYWRATPTECLPNFGNPVSSITHASGAISALILSASARRNRHPIPRRLIHELLQALLITVSKPGSHRLDALALAVQHQTAQIALTPSPLVLATHRREHLASELDQPATNTRQLLLRQPRHRTHDDLLDNNNIAKKTRPQTTNPSRNLTEHY
jgi:hypothetical protein